MLVENVLSTTELCDHDHAWEGNRHCCIWTCMIKVCGVRINEWIKYLNSYQYLSSNYAWSCLRSIYNHGKYGEYFEKKNIKIRKLLGSIFFTGIDSEKKD